MQSPPAAEPVQPNVLLLLQRLGIHERDAEEQKKWIKDRANIEAAAPALTKPERALLQAFARGDEGQKKPKEKKIPAPTDVSVDAVAGGKGGGDRAPSKKTDLARASRWLTKAVSRNPKPLPHAHA